MYFQYIHYGYEVHSDTDTPPHVLYTNHVLEK